MNSNRPRIRGKGRKQRGTDERSSLEIAYERDVLEPKLNRGEILAFGFEQLKLRLADRTFYTPDYFVLDDAGFIEAHEVKGYWEEQARIKIKVAADRYQWIRFVAITRERINKGELPARYQWIYEEF